MFFTIVLAERKIMISFTTIANLDEIKVRLTKRKAKIETRNAANFIFIFEYAFNQTI